MNDQKFMTDGMIENAADSGQEVLEKCQWLPDVINLAKTVFKEKGYLPGLLVLYPGSDELEVLCLSNDMNDRKDKDNAAAHMRHVISERDPIAYCFLSEAWAANFSTEDEDYEMWSEVATINGLSALPKEKRREVIVYNVILRKPEKERKSWLGMQEVIREEAEDEEGAILAFEECQWTCTSENEKISGRFNNLG